MRLMEATMKKMIHSPNSITFYFSEISKTIEPYLSHQFKMMITTWLKDLLTYSTSTKLII